ncbi:MAG: Hpt domain-containing protein [Thermodesulfobacteriota bacterium]|nr:Hpt domain-containing protein [Thermodesulfobacteriota bacterium]
MEQEKAKPVFDQESALERVGGDMEFLKELIDLFRSDYPQKMTQLSKGIKEEDFKTIKETGHSIKSASGNLSLTHIYDLSFKIEGMGSKGKIQGIEKAYNELEEELGKIKDLF